MKRAALAIIIAAISILCGCAQPSRYPTYPSQAPENRPLGQETLLRYPDNWPEISGRRDRRDPSD